MLSQASINDIVKGSEKVFQHMVGRIRAGVMHRLSNSGINPTEISDLDELFDSVSDPFYGLETSYLQEKFVMEELGCIVSELLMCSVTLISQISFLLCSYCILS